PGLLVSTRRADSRADEVVTRIQGLWVAFLVGLVLVYAKWWAWYGGLFWGPRFFLFAAFPASLALAVALRDAKQVSWPRGVFLLAVLTLSAWVAFDGGAYRIAAAKICREDLNYESLCWYVPEYSALWQPFVERWTMSRDEIVMAAYYGVAY